MKELKYGVPDVAVRNRDSATPKRSFFKTTAAALVAGLLYATPAAIFTMPNKAVAQETEICGRKVEVLKLEKTIAQMDMDTKPYRKGEAMPGHSVTGGYINSVTVPGKITFAVGGKEGKWAVSVFPDDKAVEINEFAGYVKRLSGQQMERVYIVLEFGTFDYNGKPTKYTTAYFYPQDKDGKFLTRMKDGDLVYYLSKFEGKLVGDVALAVAPISPNPAVAMK